ncbi:MAG: cellulose binding domain-containing protein [Terracidiphilus sp.]
MKKRSVLQMLTIALAVGFVFAGMSAPAASQSTCAVTGTIAIDSSEYIYQNNEWNSTLEQCATVSGVGFTLTTADFDLATDGAPATYPSIFRGCHWGDCTTSNPFPIEYSNLASASTSVTITQPSGYNNDAAYDIWFNQTSTTTGQPNGTEIMIWINHQGTPQPAGSDVATVTIDGANYQVWTGKESSWNIVSYVAVTPVTSVTNLNLLPFFADAVSRGSLQTTWWLIDVEYGFEVWSGGEGLAMSGYSVSAAANAGGSCTTVPSAPSGLTGTAASSSVINLSWTADTAPANCTISSYSVYGSTTSGFTPSSSNLLASGVTATSYSNTGLAASTAYYYKVEAVDSEGTSAASAQATATTQAAATPSCTTVPAAPAGLTATAASSSAINLSWTADAAPANCTINSYSVYRSTTSGFTPSSSNLVASAVTGTSYSNTGLTASTTYYYKIEAVDSDGTSAASTQANATTSAAGGSGLACTVLYAITPQNSSAFGATLTIKDTGTTALTNWTLTWTYANGQTISSLWNGAETQSGANVTVKNESYNGSIAAGGTLSGIGLNGTWNGITNAIPVAFYVNGTLCTVN